MLRSVPKRNTGNAIHPHDAMVSSKKRRVLKSEPGLKFVVVSRSVQFPFPQYLFFFSLNRNLPLLLFAALDWIEFMSFPPIFPSSVSKGNVLDLFAAFCVHGTLFPETYVKPFDLPSSVLSSSYCKCQQKCLKHKTSKPTSTKPAIDMSAT
jgi:hypothetical protein